MEHVGVVLVLVYISVKAVDIFLYRSLLSLQNQLFYQDLLRIPATDRALPNLKNTTDTRKEGPGSNLKRLTVRAL